MNVITAVENINLFLGPMDMRKPRLAMALYHAKRGINWRDTTYGSWRGFCSAEIGLSHSSIYQYIKTAEIMLKYTYTLNDSLNIVKSIGWSRFRLGLTKIDDYVDIANFIDTYKYINLNERVKFEENDTELVNFSFSIPAHDAEVLTNELIVRGMRVHKHNRMNASAAMVTLVKELFPE